MEKFIVVDVDGVGDNEDTIIEDVANMERAVDVADEFIDGVLEGGDDNEMVEVGIYKLVKTVKVVRKRSRTITSIK